MFKKNREILKMLVISLNIYVGRDFRKWFSPIPLLQAGLMLTSEQAAHGLLHILGVWLEVSQPVQCLSVEPQGNVLSAATQFSSQAAFKRPWDQSWVPGAVTSDCASATVCLKAFFSTLGFPALSFTAKESKCSVPFHREEKPRWDVIY